MDCEDERDSERCYLVGEEEAIWLLRLVLPYINEVLLNLRSLFSGEPATTMKVKPMKDIWCVLVTIGKKTLYLATCWNVVPPGIDWTCLDLY